jgi:hypothetical protein
LTSANVNITLPRKGESLPRGRWHSPERPRGVRPKGRAFRGSPVALCEPETAQALPTGRAASPAFARDLVPLAGAVGSYGLAAAFLAPTLSLFLAQDVHASPFLIGLFFVARGAASIGASQATGRLSDRLRDRRVIIGIAGASGVVGGLCVALRTCTTGRRSSAGWRACARGWRSPS